MSKSRSAVYQFFEFVGFEFDDKSKTKTKIYKCLICGEEKRGQTTSNLITHMEKASHSIQFDEYIEKMKNSKIDINSPANKKRKLDYTQGSPKTPSAASKNSFFNKISSTPKYSLQSILQKTR